MITGLLLLLAIASLVVLISVWRLPPFLAFLGVALALALLQGMGTAEAMAAVQRGIGSTLGSILPVILLGAWIGAVVARTGATRVLAEAIVGLLGRRRLALAFMVIGFLVGLPLFYAVGFFLLVPIALSVAQQYGLHPLRIGMPLLASLSIAQGYLPPHPAPYYLSQHLPGADMGIVLGWGILVSIPAMLVSGLLFSRTVGHIPCQPKAFLDEGREDSPPSVWMALAVLLAPVLLIGAHTLLGTALPDGHAVLRLSGFLGEPVVAMGASLALGVGGLGLRRGRTWRSMLAWLEESARDVAPLVFTFAGAGAFKEVLQAVKAGDTLFSLLDGWSVPPLLMGWSVAALIRIVTGSSTVAGITTAGLILPLMQSAAVDANLMVLSIGAGSMVMSHVNDSGFWLYREYFGVSMRDTLRSWTVMETLVAVTGLLGVLALDALLHG